MAIEKAHQKNCAIVIADVLADVENVMRYFPADAIEQYVRKHHGCVVWTLTDGIVWSESFQRKWFPELTWRGNSCWGAQHYAVKGNNTNLLMVGEAPRLLRRFRALHLLLIPSPPPLLQRS